MAEEEKTIENNPSAAPTPEPAETPAETSPPKNDGQPSRLDRFKTWYTERKKWTIPVSVVLFLLILAGTPFTRYALAGTVVKRDLAVRVQDDTSRTAVSGATVSGGGASAETDGNGVAILHKLKPGNHTITFSKKYYKDTQQRLLVPLFSGKTPPLISMSATGRQVKVTVHDLISNKVLKDAKISVAGISATTDQTGSTVIVLPVGQTEQKAKLSLDGYNDSDVTVKVSNDKIQDNSFNLTPAGKVYFLSKLSGKIDVVKTNLDGTGRQTVLAGTGSEEDRNTVLLSSRDWKYLALLSRRSGNLAGLYLISTADDSLTTIDQQAADFTLNGWVGDNFVYTVTRSDAQLWQSGRQQIKGFSAANKKSIVLDQTTASGTSSADYLSQLVGDVYAYNDQVFYTMNWTAAFASPSSSDIPNKQATFNSIKPDGSGKKAIRSFGLAAGTQAIDVTLQERVANPSQINLEFSDGTKDNFYTYSNGQVKDAPNQTADTFYSATYPTYLESPSANQTFWSEARDGKNTLFIGDDGGQGGKQIATLSDYSPYGWYTDNYLLVSKNGSELYIMSKAGGDTIKIADYHKPDTSFPGYGGGYGGL
jgi:hypothetical protein